MAKILSFPVQHSCPTCERICSPEDLSECLRCGQLYCSKCMWECECDRAALEMVQRAADAQKYRLTGEPISEPCEENVLALEFIQAQFGNEEL